MADDNTITNFVTHVFVLNSNITHALRYKEMFIGIDFNLPLVINNPMPRFTNDFVADIASNGR